MVLYTSDECRRTRVADMIYDRLSTSLANNSWVPKALEDNTQLVIQGRLCTPGSSDHLAVIELGTIDSGDLVSLLLTEQHNASATTTPRLSSHETWENEQDAEPALIPTPPESSSGQNTQATAQSTSKRRKVVGGLRPVYSVPKLPTGSASATIKSVGTSLAPTHAMIPRQLRSDARKLPQRAVAKRTSKMLCPATTLISSIWKTIYGPIPVGPLATLSEYDNPGLSTPDIDHIDRQQFSRINAICLKASTLSKSARALEIVVQAYWMDCYNARIRVISDENPRWTPTEARMACLGEACGALGWTQKELRNRMMIWRGYKDVRDAGGWASLVFSGSGIYRTCKYRIGFADGLMQRLARLRPAIEVAADTVHPAWRQLLAPIGQDTQPKYTGHPHDWVVNADRAVLPLSSTYWQWDPEFAFEHVKECIIDDCWPSGDPRRVYTGDIYICSECGYEQSDDPLKSKCLCFPSLFAATGPVSAPVQVERCPLGKNNGLFARCAFERGTAVGEFVGLVTKGIEGLDVMMSGSGDHQYQIYQRRVGNYTRFINHSCAPNAQFTKFIWRGIERIIVVSKGIESGMEITVDYSPSYWNNLDKVCLCGEACCRYNRPGRHLG
ncbi:MAG: hypothetical protein Q9172_003617 [Xanthocarpia lactea]